MSGRILVVDDDQRMRELLRDVLVRRGWEVREAAGADAALENIRAEELDVLLSDLRMRGTSGIELCERAVAVQPGLPVVVMTAFGSLDTAVSAIRAGAYDFITKPFEMDVVLLALERALGHRRLSREVTRLRDAVEQGDRLDDIVGESLAMRAVTDMLERVSDSEATVLVTGESGTGKELVARALHRRGKRRAGPFVAINCAAVPETLLEAELFGHAKGAFTDARGSRTGLFMQANGGTLFLDEIAEMAPGMQAKLLRALQERTVRPVGGSEEIAFDARLVAATNQDVEALVSQGTFRQDLYYRLAVVEVHLPPLRARGNDVLLLAQHLLGKYASAAGRPVGGISPDAARRLLAYDWPGNVRELANCIERCVALARFDQITVDDLPARITAPKRAPSAVVDELDELLPLEEIERRYVLRVLAEVGGKRGLAAQVLGVDRKTLYRKLERWGVREEGDA